MNNLLSIIHGICFIILIYFTILWSGYLIFLLCTFKTIIRKYYEAKFNDIMGNVQHQFMVPITIIIPAYNELLRIENVITAILNTRYPNIHIVIVNDGSIDTMLQFLIDKYQLVQIPAAFNMSLVTARVNAYYESKIIKNFRVVDKEHSPFLNSGADSINAGLNICCTPIYLTVDADTILEPDALSQILFVYLTNPHCIAVGGAIYVPDPAKIQNGKITSTNIPLNFILGVQVVEYLRSFLYGREGWSLFGGVFCHPGAFSLLETEVVKQVGGYDAYNFSYDAEIIIKLHQYMLQKHYPYSVVYAPSAISWSEEPRTIRGLWRQRSYWQRGLLRCIALHKQMIFNPRYGITGLFAFPIFILFEILGPIIESFSYIMVLILFGLNLLHYVNMMWLVFLAWGYMMSITMLCMLLSMITYNQYYRKMDIVHFFVLTTIDMLFYRQLRAFCALYAFGKYLLNRLRGKPI